MTDLVNIGFWVIKNLNEILDKLNARDFNATSLSTYDFPLFTLLCLINKLKINVLISLKESSKKKPLLTLHVTTETRFSLQSTHTYLMHGLAKM